MLIKYFCYSVNNGDAEYIKLLEGIRVRQILNWCSTEAEKGFTEQDH